MAGSLAPFALAADQFPLVHLLLAVSRVAGDSAIGLGDIRGDLKN